VTLEAASRVVVIDFISWLVTCFEVLSETATTSTSALAGTPLCDRVMERSRDRLSKEQARKMKGGMRYKR